MKKIKVPHISLFLIFIFTFVVASFFSILGVDIEHDGVILKPALDVAGGKALFRESYFHYGAFSNFVYFFPLVILGEKLIYVKLTAAFFYGLTAIFIYLSSRKFLSPVLSFFSVIIWISLSPYFIQVFYPWPSIYSAFFTTVTLYLFLLIFKKDKLNFKPLTLFLLGVSSSLAFWSKQPYLLISAAVVTYFILLFLLKVINLKILYKSLLNFFFGFIVISFIFLAILTASGSLGDWFFQTIRAGYIEGRILGRDYNIFSVAKYLSLTSVFLLFPLSALFFFFKSLKNLKSNASIKLLGVSIICLASLFQLYPLYDVSHIYWAITPIVGLGLYFLYTLINIARAKNSFSVLIYIFVILMAFSLLVEVKKRIVTGTQKIAVNNITVSSPYVLESMKMDKTEADFYKTLSENMDNFFKKNPDKQFIILGREVLVTTFTDRIHSFGPYYANFSGIVSGFYNYDEDLGKFILNNKPLILDGKNQKGKLKNYTSIYSFKDFSLMSSTEED